MKRKLSRLLSVLALACAAYALLGNTQLTVFSSLVTFPFRQIGRGLRALSLSGEVGNAFAILLYIALCLCPVGILLVKKHRRWEDALLPVLSFVMFPVMYLMVNPQLQASWLGQIYSMVGGELLCLILWSVIIGYGFMKLLHQCLDASGPQLLDYLRWLVAIYCIVLIFAVFGTGLDSLLTQIEAIRTANNGFARGLSLTFGFLVIQYFVNSLPNLLLCGVLLDAAELVNALKGEEYTEELVLAAERLGLRCGRVLILVVLSNVIFNLVQLLTIRQLHNVSTVVRMPLGMMLLVVALLVAARFIRAHKELKDENDSFI